MIQNAFLFVIRNENRLMFGFSVCVLTAICPVPFIGGLLQLFCGANLMVNVTAAIIITLK